MHTWNIWNKHVKIHDVGDLKLMINFKKIQIVRKMYFLPHGNISEEIKLFSINIYVESNLCWLTLRFFLYSFLPQEKKMSKSDSNFLYQLGFKWLWITSFRWKRIQMTMNENEWKWMNENDKWITSFRWKKIPTFFIFVPMQFFGHWIYNHKKQKFY